MPFTVLARFGIRSARRCRLFSTCAQLLSTMFRFSIRRLYPPRAQPTTTSANSRSAPRITSPIFPIALYLRKFLGAHRFPRAGFIFSDFDRMPETMKPARWKRCVSRGQFSLFQGIAHCDMNDPFESIKAQCGEFPERLQIVHSLDHPCEAIEVACEQVLNFDLHQPSGL